MAIEALFSENMSVISVALASVIAIISLFRYLFHKPPFPKNAPRQTTEAWPILGSLQFFTERWDFYKRCMAQSRTGNFSFYAGQWPVIGLAGDAGRKVFFESKALGFSEGYGALLGGTPVVREDNNPFANDNNQETGFSAYFNKRIISMLKGNRLADGLPKMLSDAREQLDKLAAEPSGMTDPFESIYRMVYRFTMRTVACNEIADDPALLNKTLHLYEQVEATATPLSIMFPWMPVLAKFKRFYSGGRLHMIFKRVVDKRKKEGRRENDALQYLMDQGDSITDMITFVLGALFAGQLNTGVNAAWVLVYLASKPYWLERVLEEVQSVASRYAPDTDLPLKEQLMHVPANAWEGEFPIVDMCLKDSIRLQMSGTAFRQNISGKDILLNKAGSEVIPKDAYVTLSAGDGHYNPSFFENPDEWDPSRYMPDRAEDKKGVYSFFGWGVGRHPCLGMRFAKMEVNVIVAFFLAYFQDIELVDKNGNPRTKLPAVDRNRHTAARPDERVYLKFSRRSDKIAA